MENNKIHEFTALEARDYCLNISRWKWIDFSESLGGGEWRRYAFFPSEYGGKDVLKVAQCSSQDPMPLTIEKVTEMLSFDFVIYSSLVFRRNTPNYTYEFCVETDGDLLEETTFVTHAFDEITAKWKMLALILNEIERVTKPIL